MPRRPFRVGRSRTGLGLFATRPIRKRACASPNTKAACSTTKEADKLEARGNLYLYEINSRWTIDGTPRSNIARYFNHSCNPNAEIYDVKHRVFIRTLRNIKPGEEIIYDYGVDYLKNVIGRSNCKCGRCRGGAPARRANAARCKSGGRRGRPASASEMIRSSPRKRGPIFHVLSIGCGVWVPALAEPVIGRALRGPVGSAGTTTEQPRHSLLPLPGSLAAVLGGSSRPATRGRSPR